jgi:hypothetical protein
LPFLRGYRITSKLLAGPIDLAQKAEHKTEGVEG